MGKPERGGRRDEDPQRNYLRAIAIAVPAVALGYILPLAVCLQGASSAATWHTGSFAEQGVRIGGSLLGTFIAAGGALSSFAIFEAAMLWVSRLPVRPGSRKLSAAEPNAESGAGATSQAARSCSAAPFLRC